MSSILNKVLVILFLSASSLSFSQSQLINGPMVGYSAMRESAVWVQTDGEASVSLIYYTIPTGSEAVKKYRSEPVQTSVESAYTATLVADSLEPGRTYTYQVEVDGEILDFDYPTTFKSQELWQHRTEPPNWTMAMGSCTYINEKKYDRPGKPYGGDYQIFESIFEQSPDMMLWLGDNTYLREVDWDSKSGFQHRYKHSRDVDEMRPLLGSANNYAIWDDHDYGPNNADRSYIHKNWALETFKEFWANPSYGFKDEECATTMFTYNDAAFFMLDNRWFKSPNDRKTGDRVYLGKKQIQWLIDALVTSKATFKFVAIGGQVLNTVDKYENYATYPEERKMLIDAIFDEGIRNVIFLTGDRHKTELSKLERGDNQIYDLTVSPLTSTAYNSVDENNENRIEGTHYGKRNFGIMKMSGPYKERKATIEIRDTDGELIWTRDIQRW
jgi:alkaline phosphatase D